MSVFESGWVISAKPPFLHSLDVLIKVFANSLADLNQQTLGRTEHVNCFQTQLTESCLVVCSGQTRHPSVVSFSIKKVQIPRIYSGLMESGKDLKFTFYSKIFLSLQQVHGEVDVSVQACTNNCLRCTKCEVHDRARKYVVRRTKKRVPRFLIFEALPLFLEQPLPLFGKIQLRSIPL